MSFAPVISGESNLNMLQFKDNIPETLKQIDKKVDKKHKIMKKGICQSETIKPKIKKISVTNLKNEQEDLLLNLKQIVEDYSSSCDSNKSVVKKPETAKSKMTMKKVKKECPEQLQTFG